MTDVRTASTRSALSARLEQLRNALAGTAAFTSVNTHLFTPTDGTDAHDIGIEQLQSLHTDFGVNINWLLCGEGPMFQKTPQTGAVPSGDAADTPPSPSAEIEEALFFQVLESIDAVVATIERDGTMSYINRFGCDLTGCSARETASRPYFWFDRFIPSDIRPDIRQIIDNMSDSETFVSRKVNPWIDRNGEHRMIEWANSVIRTPDNGLKLVTVGIDITAETRAREKEQHLLRSLYRAQEIAKTGSFTHDLLNGAFDTSPEYRRIHGLDPNLPCSLDALLERVHPDDIKGLLDTINEAHATCRIPGTTYRVLIGNQTRWMHVKWFYRLDEDGTLAAVDGITSDVTEMESARMQLEALNATLEEKVARKTKELSDQLQLLDETQEIGNIGSYRIDFRDNTVRVTPKTMKMLGLGSERVSTGELFASVHPDDVPTLRDYARTIIADPAQRSGDFELITLQPDGREAHFSLIWEKSTGPLGQLIAKGVIQDITEDVVQTRRIKEQEGLLLQKNRLSQLGEMVSMIAHQWRQPLASINSLVSVMMMDLTLAKEGADDALVETMLGSLHGIETISIEMSDVITSFRNFYQSENSEAMASMDTLITEVLGMLRHKIVTGEIRVETRLDAPDPINLYPVEIKQVLLAILQNANDAYAGAGIRGGSITITTSLTDGWCRADIEDSAGGIPETIIDRIFDPYFTTKGGLNGTGLGLYMSKMIIEKHHGGSIQAKHAKHGVTFTLLLPVS